MYWGKNAFKKNQAFQIWHVKVFKFYETLYTPAQVSYS